MHSSGVDHDEDDADHSGKQQVDRDADQFFDVSSNLLQFPERFAAALVLKQ